MEIYFNELSILPLSNSIESSKEKLVTLLKTMKALNDYDFNVLRTHDNFYAEDFGGGYSAASFINDTTINRGVRQLLQTIVKSPFIKEDDSIEAETFVENQFQTINHLGELISPEGIAVAFIHNVPTLSLDNFSIWNNETLSLTIIYTATNTITTENVINVSSPISVTNSVFLNWIKSITTDIQLNSKDNILKKFPKEIYDIEPRAMEELISWFYDDKRYLARIIILIENIRNAPFVGGIGSTENLGGGRGSKRILKKDRVVYTVLEKKIIIHSCKRHYNDH